MWLPIAIPSAIISLAYATTNNFTGKVIYPKNAKAVLAAKAMPLLVTASELAKAQGYRLKIFDAFRPRWVQQKLWDACPDANYIMPPAKGSPHSRGVAIDLTLATAQGKELDMGAGFDEFAAISHHGNPQITATQAANRYTLMGIMVTAGWDFYRNEWWHYQLFDAKTYPFLPPTALTEPPPT